MGLSGQQTVDPAIVLLIKTKKSSSFAANTTIEFPKNPHIKLMRVSLNNSFGVVRASQTLISLSNPVLFFECFDVVLEVP